ncbi:iron complex outermembrane receptor protein [Pelomonas saccharophila]|uniref:Iron complex outermembrane receptor protein n=1 Tax=Roseateles saccharophilus TaxID=304 RepID=A0ABU1YLT0_ROSSA|nr:TonB-dependent receptor [Roseateles saccharophilus]MDR7269817.1 iron complex outermembrane receptor protein [Roseateles saccharophilus]
MKSSGHIPKLAVTLTALAAQAFCGQAFAQTQLERVEVTGSNIKRISRETTSPIDVITAKDIQASGARTALDIMKMIPAIGNDGYNDTPAQNGFSRGVATVSLRNLSATSTLVLINSRRMAPAAYANPNNGTSTLYDLNTIPAAAIERIEVLKDGAAAVYGSDAIAGVINFILKQNFQGLEAKVVAGMNDANEYKRQTLSVTAGMGDLAQNGYNVFVGLDYTHKGRSMVNDKTDEDISAADYRAINLRRNPYGSFLYNDFAWFTRESQPNNRSFPQTNAANMVTKATCADSEKITNTTSDVYGITTGALANRTFCNYNLDQFVEMQNPGNDLNVMSRGTLKVTDDFTAFAEVGYSRNKRQYLAAPRTISGLSPASSFMLGAAAPTFQAILEVGHPDNPFPNARAAVQMRFPNAPGGYNLTNTGARALVGAKGTIRNDIDWESAVLWNRTERDEYYYGFLRLPVLRQMLGPQSGGTNRSLSSIANDPDLSRPLLNNAASSIVQWDLKASTEIGKLPGGPIGLAGGVEVRREAIEVNPDPENAAGNILGLANTAVRGSRNVKSAFVEVNAPVFKSLELNLAGRVDKYPGIKTNFVPKIGLMYRPNTVVALRGSYSEGFRAPAVSQVSPGGAQFFVNNLIDPVRCDTSVSPNVPKPGAETADCNKSVSGMGGANPALRPENSFNSSLGLILSPMKDVDMLVSWFRIRRNGEVALGDAQSVLDHPNAYPPSSIVRDTNPALLLNGQPGTGPLLSVATPWENQGSTMVQGLDFEGRLVARFDQVKWTNAINGTYMLKYERVERNGYATGNNLVGTNGGLADWATSVGDIPRMKFRVTSTLDNGPHSIMGAMNFVSGVSFRRQMDTTNIPGVVSPAYYSGQTCHYGDLAAGDPFLSGRSKIGAAPTAVNGRDFYINRYPSCSVSSWTTFDLSYTYTGFKDLTLGLAIQNFMDEKSPYYPTTSTGTAAVQGYNAGLHNPYGRYFTVSASYKFK